MTKTIALTIAIAVTGCTPLARAQGLASVGAVACATGHGATAAGEDWGAIVSAAGCWLAGWAADRSDKRRELAQAAERLRVALAAADQDLDAETAAAVERAHKACTDIEAGS